MSRPSKSAAATVVWLLLASTVPVRAVTERSSLAPLTVERADTLGSGKAEFAFGFSYADDERFPFFTEPGSLRSQTRLQLPTVGLRIGAGDFVEIQAAYDLIYLDETAANGQTNWQYGGGDSRLHTKIKLKSEDDLWPGLAIRFGTKLPNANRHDRLGTDDTDFDLSAIASKDFGPVTTHVNLGILLLGNSGPFFNPNAFKAGGQDDLFTYRIAAVSAPLGSAGADAAHLQLMAELAGQGGTHYFNDRHSLRVGAQISRGNGAIYLGTSLGLVSASENVGVSAGFIYNFDPAAWFSGE
ncbi:MAG: hypothetical protein HY270_15395 [Deltaproteobacteria bacterium]|nr:hypothetical protein [Deltaproteobacteria bacterium]